MRSARSLARRLSAARSAICAVLSSACDAGPMLPPRRRDRNPALRLSATEREHAIETLKAHYAEGRLGTQELEARVEDVYRSDTRRQVVTHFRDLPLRGMRGLVV